MQQYTLIEPDHKTDFHSLYDKIQPFLEPNAHVMLEFVDLHQKRADKPLQMNIEDYNATVRLGKKFMLPENTEYVLVEKPFYESMSFCGYLSSAEKWEKKGESDELDKQFIQNKGTNLKQMEFYGLHSYGSSRMFFRPDLLEVMTLVSAALPPLDAVQRIYVTSTAHPTNDIGECYDSKADRHRAKTVVYIAFKKNKRKIEPGTSLEPVGQECATLLREENKKVRIEIECEDTDTEDQVVSGFTKEFRKQNKRERKAFNMYGDKITSSDGSSSIVFSRAAETSISINFI